MRILLWLGFWIVLISCSTEPSKEGDVFFEEGEYQQAILAYNEYLKSNAPNVTVIYNRGRSYEEIGRYDEAIADFEAVLEMNEKNVNAKLSISKVKYEQKKYTQALLMAEEALEIQSNSAIGHFLVARSKHQLGYTDSAMDSYDLAISNDREYGEAFLYRGALKVAMENVKGGCEDFNKAKNLNTEGAASALSKYCR